MDRITLEERMKEQGREIKKVTIKDYIVRDKGREKESKRKRE